MLHAKKFIVLLAACSLLAACTGLQRGLAGSSLVSSARPAVELSVPSLPLRTAGFTVANVTTSDSLGGVPVEAWLAVYGGTTVNEPMAIVSLAVAPTSYIWDSDMSRIFSVDKGVVDYNGQGFYACTYIITGERDPFISLLPAQDGMTAKFLARRFAQRSNFNENKITLEYREPLPADITELTDLALYSREYISAFEERAYKAFVVGVFPQPAPAVTGQYLQGVEVRYLNTNFFGTMTRLDAMDFE